MCKLLVELIFKVYETNSLDIFMDSFEMLELLKDGIKVTNDFKDNIDHIYLIIPQLLNSIRASVMINVDELGELQAIFTEQEATNDEIEKIKTYRLFAADHLRK
jgi:hypothetical protein